MASLKTLVADVPAAPTPAPDATALPLPIILVGMPGAGKTTIGRGLARVLGRPFVDVDHELEKRCGVRVAVIFDLEGEEGFRQRETSVIEEYARMPGTILATGGGAVLRPENRRIMRERGVVLYLRARPEDLYARTRNDRSRPLLLTDDPMATLRALYEVREPLYREVAHITIDTGKIPVHHLINRITPMLRTYSSEPELLCKK